MYSGVEDFIGGHLGQRQMKTVCRRRNALLDAPPLNVSRVGFIGQPQIR